MLSLCRWHFKIKIYSKSCVVFKTFLRQ
jgi:hypothetical protein